jgi:membrane protein
MTGEGFVRDNLLLRASALSYFTVLSLVPLLAVAISIVGSLGVGVNFAEMIVGQLAAGPRPRPDPGRMIRDVAAPTSGTSTGALTADGGARHSTVGAT